MLPCYPLEYNTMLNFALYYKYTYVRIFSIETHITKIQKYQLYLEIRQWRLFISCLERVYRTKDVFYIG